MNQTGQQLNPTDYRTYNLRVKARVEVGDINTAIADFQAISLNPQAAAVIAPGGFISDALERSSKF